jgi:hypothetical protein
MAEFLALRGAAAFSASRLARLQKSVGEQFAGVKLAAEHWYFVELDADAVRPKSKRGWAICWASPRRCPPRPPAPAAGDAAPGHDLALELEGHRHRGTAALPR